MQIHNDVKRKNQGQHLAILTKQAWSHRTRQKCCPDVGDKQILLLSKQIFILTCLWVMDKGSVRCLPTQSLKQQTETWPREAKFYRYFSQGQAGIQVFFIPGSIKDLLCTEKRTLFKSSSWSQRVVPSGQDCTILPAFKVGQPITVMDLAHLAHSQGCSANHMLRFTDLQLGEFQCWHFHNQVQTFD